MIDPVMLALAKKLGGGGGNAETTVETDILPLTTYEGFFYDEVSETYGNLAEVHSSLTIGETYMVVWDGETYECVGQDASSIGGEGVILGNAAIWGLLGNDEPFALLIAEGHTALVALTDTEAGGSHTVRIYQKTVASSKVPAVSAADNGKFLQVVDGAWEAVSLTDVSEVGA